jgi:hypothetical protein
LLDKDPLTNIRNTNTISGVFTGKNWYDRGAIHKMLEGARIKM